MVQADKQKKRQTILFAVLAVAVLVGVFILYSNYYENKSKTEKSQEATAEIISGFERELGKVKLELDILDNKLFKSLKSYGVLPVTPGETGQENPFQPH